MPGRAHSGAYKTGRQQQGRNRGGHLAAGGGDGDPGEVDGAAAPGPAPVAGGVAQRADGGAPRLPGRVLPRVLVMHTP